MSEMIPEKKNNTTRNILIALGAVAALCICAAIVAVYGLKVVGPKVATSLSTQVGGAVKTDPAEIAQLANGIVDFDMPPGYKYEMGMSFLNYDIAALAPTDLSKGYAQIMLIQTPNSANVSEEQLRAQAESMSQQSSSGGGTMVVVETRDETIRGQQVVVTISESTSGSTAMRQWVTFFNGKGGLVVLMIQGQVDGWDEQLFLNFIHSIR